MLPRPRAYNKTLSEWNPMKEEFDNSTHASQTPEIEVQGGVELNHTRLYIRNIPTTLTQTGLFNAFSKFGTMKECYLSEDVKKRYALVQYHSQGEANLAMTEMNRKEPFNFYISIAHNQSARNSSTLKQRETTNNKNGRNDNVSRGNANVPRRNNAEVSRQRTTSHTASGESFSDRKEMANGDIKSSYVDMLETDVDDVEEDDIELKMEQLKLRKAQRVCKQRYDAVLEAKERTQAPGNDDPDVDLDLEMAELSLKQAQLDCKKHFLAVEAIEKRKGVVKTPLGGRRLMPDGRIVMNVTDQRAPEAANKASSIGSATNNDNSVSNARDDTTVCSCDKQCHSAMEWERNEESSGSTCSTCTVLCSLPSSKSNDDVSQLTSTTTPSHGPSSQSTNVSIVTNQIDPASRKSDTTSKKLEWKNSVITCEFKYSGVNLSSDLAKETDRLIELRGSDYADIVADSLKVVIALAGYPKTKMSLRQIGQFQDCLTEIMEMQLKAGFLKRLPVFLDYYLNRGALVCVCKDDDTRDWVVRISPGLQERMRNNLIFLKSKVKRLCLAMLKISKGSWPTTAVDVFKLLQYFNANLKTDLWEIYSQKMEEGVEYTSFLIDRISGEIIRGPRFKNVIDYSQIEFELTGYTEMYYECFLSDFEEVCSVASRVRLLNDIRSKDLIPTQMTEVNIVSKQNDKSNKRDVGGSTSDLNVIDGINANNDMDKVKSVDNDEECSTEVEQVSEEENKMTASTHTWSGDNEEPVNIDDAVKDITGEDAITGDEESMENKIVEQDDTASTENTESLIGSRNTFERNSVSAANNKKGLAFNRRTNYIYVENELKVAFVLEGYPTDKLDGSHVRRLKNLFKEHVHKDRKIKKFPDLIIPEFIDMYLSNGALVYICDSMETKDYLLELLPKLVNSTRLKLCLKGVEELLRFTRVVMRLPKEYSQVESIEILTELQVKYPGLKPDCWKYYSDFPGRQKRQFGVDPDSIEIIKQADFNATYKGEAISFIIVDRVKRDSNFNEYNNEMSVLINAFLETLYEPFDLSLVEKTQTELRRNHYFDLIEDDLKVYVSPSDYPELRVDENMFNAIKNCLDLIAYDTFKSVFDIEDMPRIHDIYLFEGVILILCKNFVTKTWIKEVIPKVNFQLRMNLKVNEFRGTVGIVTLKTVTDKEISEVIEDLQYQNPRLRTKFWRILNTKDENKVVITSLQIDRLSARVIKESDFDNVIDGSEVLFELNLLYKTECSLKTHSDSIKQTDSSSLFEKSIKSTQIITIKMWKTININRVRSSLRKQLALDIPHWKVLSGNNLLHNKIYDVEIDSESASVLLKSDFSFKIGKRRISFNAKIKEDDQAMSAKTPEKISWDKTAKDEDLQTV